MYREGTLQYLTTDHKTTQNETKNELKIQAKISYKSIILLYK